jgi:hypothetical protein
MALSRSQLQRALEHLQASDWQAAHEIVQKDEDSALACWAHGIVHLMEGDLPNARYWYREAKRTFPANADGKAETAALARALEEKASP